MKLLPQKLKGNRNPGKLISWKMFHDILFSFVSVDTVLVGPFSKTKYMHVMDLVYEILVMFGNVGSGKTLVWWAKSMHRTIVISKPVERSGLVWWPIYCQFFDVHVLALNRCLKENDIVHKDVQCYQTHMIQREKLGTRGRVPEIYTNIYHPYMVYIYIYNGCLGQYGVIFC